MKQRPSNHGAIVASVLVIVATAGCTPVAQGPQTRYQVTVQARARFERGEFRASQRALATLARDTRDPVAWTNLGIAEFRRGKRTAGERAWTTALGFDPRHARAHYWLGVAARARAEAQPEERRAHLEAAAQAFAAAANADPTSAAIVDALANTYVDLERHADATRAREELRRLDAAGTAVATAAAELGTIVLPPRPQSAGGRVPFAFHSELTAHRATGVATSDVNGDGRADLVLEGTNVVLLADSIAGGGIAFAPQVLGEIGRVTGTVSLLADRDDRDDLVLFTEPGEPAAAVSDEPTAAAASPGRAAPAKRLVVRAEPAPSTQLWLVRGGSVAAYALGTVDAIVRAACSADIDRDGDPDLVLAASVAPGVRVWRNDGNGGFHADAVPSLDAVPPLRQVVCADFNGDLRADLVIADAAGRLRFWVQGTAATFLDVTRNAGLAQERARVVDAADVDGDGRLDLVAGNQDGLWILRNRGDSRFARDAAYRAPQTAYVYGRAATIGVVALARFDVDNDGGEDILTLHPRSDSAMPVLIATAPKSAARPGTTPVATEDTAPELPLPFVREAATLALWRATGRGVLQGLDDRFDAAETLTGGVAAADFDLDGDLDLACVRPDSAVVVHWNAGGNANRRLRVAVANGAGARAAVGARVEVHAGDLVRVADVSSAQQWIGVRNLAHLDVVRVTWPDGRIDNWLDVPVPADGRLQLRAGTERD